jgi:formamidopyrimidine-DNA glycosylase
MPELPEVETLARDLRKAVVGRTIMEACVSSDAPRLVQQMPVDAFCAGLCGRRIEGTGRRGKFLLIGLSAEAATGPSPSPPRLPLPRPAQDDSNRRPPRRGEPALSVSEGAQDDNIGLWWIVHRRMSGNMIHRQQGAPDEPYLRARFRLDDGTELRFIDLRKFGTMWLVDDPAPVLAGLGPEPLDASFTDDVLAAILKKRSAPVKAVLLDQAAIAGIGNLYADEALHYARIHPLRPANTLKRDDAGRLRAGIVRALEQGLRNLGSSIGYEEGEAISLRDHVNLSGEPGGNQEYVVAYGREGRECLTCHSADIERLKIGNRSAHYCPKCQPRPRTRKPRRK